MPEPDPTRGNIAQTAGDARELARRTAAQIQDIAYIFERDGHYRITGRAATDLEGWTLVGAYGPDGTWRPASPRPAGARATSVRDVAPHLHRAVDVLGRLPAHGAGAPRGEDKEQALPARGTAGIEITVRLLDRTAQTADERGVSREALRCAALDFVYHNPPLLDYLAAIVARSDLGSASAQDMSAKGC
jgi:hypothetical protein